MVLPLAFCLGLSAMIVRHVKLHIALVVLSSVWSYWFW